MAGSTTRSVCSPTQVAKDLHKQRWQALAALPAGTGGDFITVPDVGQIGATMGPPARAASQDPKSAQLRGVGHFFNEKNIVVSDSREICEYLPLWFQHHVFVLNVIHVICQDIPSVAFDASCVPRIGFFLEFDATRMSKHPRFCYFDGCWFTKNFPFLVRRNPYVQSTRVLLISMTAISARIFSF